MPVRSYRLLDVVGQRATARLLARMVQRSRLPHALILEGLPGCGRRTFARALIAAHLCRDRRDGDACGTCEACRLVAEGTHPDVIELPNDADPLPEGADSADLSRNLPVEWIRTRIAESAATSSLLGGGRAFLIPSAERMGLDGANAVLKVLEEPPAGALLILTVRSVSALLPTIRSRAQRFRLMPLTAGEVEEVLRRQGVPPSAAKARAAHAQGSHRGLDDAGQVPLERLRSILTAFSSAEIGALVAALPARLDVRAEASGRTLAAEQRRVCAAWLASLERSLAGDLHGGGADRALVQLDRIAQARSDLGRNLPPRLVFEALSLGK